MNLFKDFFRDCGRRFAQPRSGAHIFIARGPFGGCLSVGGCKLPWQIFRGFILVYGGAFGAVGRGGFWAVSEVESSVRLAFRDISCWEASVTLYLWFLF